MSLPLPLLSVFCLHRLSPVSSCDCFGKNFLLLFQVEKAIRGSSSGTSFWVIVPQQPPGVSLDFDLFGLGLDWSFVPLLLLSGFLRRASPLVSPAARRSGSSVLQASEESWPLSSASLGVLLLEFLVLCSRGGTRVQP
ncbi:hypothetical protein Bca4012_067789 [Brassica carinata]